MVDISSQAFRMALWETYNYKCFYCGNIISQIDNMEVDHIIPKKYKEKPAEFQKLKDILKLDENFDVDEYYNLVPSHPGCNRRKWDRISEKITTIFYLSEASKYVEKIKNREEDLNNNISLSKIKYSITIALRNEIDVKKVKEFKYEVDKKFNDLAIQTEDNKKILQRSLFRKRLEDDLHKIQSISLENLLIEMDIPVNNNLFAANEFIRRIQGSDITEQLILIKKIINYCNNRPHAIFRVSIVHIIAQLIDDSVILEIEGKPFDLISYLNNLLLNNIKYWNSNNIQYALCHLDNITVRLAKIMSINLFLNKIVEMIKIINQERKDREILEKSIDPAYIMLNYYNFFGEMFWIDFCSLNNEEEIWDGYRLCQYAISLVSKLPSGKYPKGEEDLTQFENYGGTFDMYCYGTWDIMRKHSGILRGLNQEIIDFINLEHNQVRTKIPPLNIPKKDIIQLINKYNQKNIVKVILLILNILKG